MGYTKIVQMSHVTIVTEYEKDVLSKRMSRRRKKRRSQPVRSSRSINRARVAFFNLVEHNLNIRDDLPWFLTLTYHNEYEVPVGLTTAYGHLQTFFSRVKRSVCRDITYIVVPEWQKRGAVHFHALVWGFPQSVEEEKHTRILQRLWEQGYLDVRRTVFRSPRLSGYLAKYLSKAKADARLGNRKAYTVSRNIERPREKGSNSLFTYLSTLLDFDTLSETYEYNTAWLGKAKVSKYKGVIPKIKNDSTTRKKGKGSLRRE